MYQVIASYFIYSGLPSNLNYNWNFGSLLGVILAMQIATGVSLGMHYTANVDLSFILVEQIMRDVQYGWLIRYLHCNGASLFFLLVYLHIGRGLYSGSYLYPRHKLWNYGVVIYLIMMGEMALPEMFYLNTPLIFTLPRIKAIDRIGPHNLDILSLFIGSLLGDATIYRYKNSIRIRFEQSSIHKDYLFFLFRKIQSLGYTYSYPKLNQRKNNPNFGFVMNMVKANDLGKMSKEEILDIYDNMEDYEKALQRCEPYEMAKMWLRDLTKRLNLSREWLQTKDKTLFFQDPEESEDDN
jgi:hypothetical protein